MFANSSFEDLINGVPLLAMRIQRLELHNFRNLSHLVLEDLPNFILLVSQNGIGKSTILEAIAGIKDLVVPYHRDDYSFRESWENKGYPVWPDHLRAPMKLGAKEASISIEVEATGYEREYLVSKGINDNVGTGTIKIENGKYVTESQFNPTIKELFKYHKPVDGIGFLHYLRPIRYYDKHDIGNFVEAMKEVQLKESASVFHRRWNDQNNFNLFKDFVVASDLNDLSHLKDTDERVDALSDLKEVFNFLFAPKKFLGSKRLADGVLGVAIRTPFGDHDIDQMSDGEKEMLNILGLFYRFRALCNITLWDTPEMHLNAALEARLYQALQLIAPNDQYWIATHSLELIGSVPLENIFAIRQDDNGIRVERPTQPSRKARIQLYKELGAQVGLQLIASRIVFVEGEDDEQILRYICPEIVSLAKFVDSVGVRRLKGIVDVLLEAGDDDNFCAICDRDDLTINEIQVTEQKGQGRLYIWRYREIENYLLDEAIIWAVLQDWNSLKPKDGVKFGSEADVLEALKDAANKTKNEVVAKKISYEFNGFMDTMKLEPQNLEASLGKAIEKRLKFFEYSEPSKRIELIERVRKEIEVSWSEKWKQECLGKETLRSFLNENFGKQHDTIYHTFLEKICKEMNKSSRVPQEILHVIEMIRG